MRDYRHAVHSPLPHHIFFFVLLLFFFFSTNPKIKSFSSKIIYRLKKKKFELGLKVNPSSCIFFIHNLILYLFYMNII